MLCKNISVLSLRSMHRSACIMYSEEASNQPLSKIYAHIVYYQRKYTFNHFTNFSIFFINFAPMCHLHSRTTFISRLDTLSEKCASVSCTFINTACCLSCLSLSLSNRLPHIHLWRAMFIVIHLLHRGYGKLSDITFIWFLQRITAIQDIL